MSKINDLTGKRFGKLLVLDDSGNRDRGRVLWTCICDCGNIREVIGTYLSSGAITSCGYHYIKDMTGKKFGRLLVLREGKRPISSKCIWWECLCDCGTIKTINGASLRDGTTRSCGCLARETSSKINSISYGKANFNHVFNQYKDRARRDKIVFELSESEFMNIVKLNCRYCGSSPKSVRNRPNSNGEFIYNGIDRVDNSKGYTIDNCVPCCGICNRMKLVANKEDFLSQVKRIYEFTFGKNYEHI